MFLGSARLSTSSKSRIASIMDKILKKVELGKFITTVLKSIVKLVKLQSLVAKRCKMWKI